MTGNSGLWAYAITEPGGGDALTKHGGGHLSRLTGVAGATVRTVAAGGFTVLVSDVDLAEFGEVALRRNLENLTWLEEVARAHHHVIDAASGLFPLLPTRLATVYSSHSAMVAALARRGEELRRLWRVQPRLRGSSGQFLVDRPRAGPRGLLGPFPGGELRAAALQVGQSGAGGCLPSGLPTGGLLAVPRIRLRRGVRLDAPLHSPADPA